MQFIVATQHFAGLGFALRLQREGHEVVLAHSGVGDRRTAAEYDLVGKGIVPKAALRDVVDSRERYRNAYWIWDENHSVDANDMLRREGFRVFGGGTFADTMEHDRDACLAFVYRYGLRPPPSFAFEDAAAAADFVESHSTTAYVYKPDRGENYETWLPQSDDAAAANLELRQHLRSLTNRSPFVLQELKDGVETNVEVWFVRGEPRFAFMQIESKKKPTGDLGSHRLCLRFRFRDPARLSRGTRKRRPAFPRVP